MLGKLEKGDIVTVTSIEFDGKRAWGGIKYKGKSAYFAIEYANLVWTDGSNSLNHTGNYTVNASSLKLRSLPGTKYKVLSVLKRNTKLSVTSIRRVGSQIWGKVVVNGKKGWCALEYCKFK